MYVIWVAPETQIILSSTESETLYSIPKLNNISQPTFQVMAATNFLDLKGVECVIFFIGIGVLMLETLLKIESNRMLVIMENVNTQLQHSIENNKLIPLKEIATICLNIDDFMEFLENTSEYKNLWIPYTKMKHLSKLAFDCNLFLVDYQINT